MKIKADNQTLIIDGRETPSVVLTIYASKRQANRIRRGQTPATEIRSALGAAIADAFGVPRLAAQAGVDTWPELQDADVGDDQ